MTDTDTTPEQRNEAGQFTEGNKYAHRTRKQKTRLEMFEQRLKQRHPTEKGTYSQVLVNKLIDKAIDGDIKAMLKVIEILEQIDNKNSDPIGFEF